MDASQNSLNKIEATLTPVFVLGVLALVVGVIDAAVLIYFALPAVNLASALSAVWSLWLDSSRMAVR